MTMQATTSQTVGPFFSIGFTWLTPENLAAPGVSGEPITIEGRVLDGDGHPVPDAILELWQANSHGKYVHPEDTQDKPLEKGFTGFGRIPTDAEGKFRFTTIKPGQVPGSGAEKQLQAPHIAVSVFARVSATTLHRTNMELWRTIAVVALAVLMFEWWYYHRRTV